MVTEEKFSVDRVAKLIRPALRRAQKVRPQVWFVLGAVALLSSSAAGFSRTQRPLAASIPEQQTVQVAGPVAIKFTQEVAGGIHHAISPKVDGEWREHRGLLGVSSVSFEPTTRLQAGLTYTVRLSNLKRVGTRAYIPDVVERFKTQIPAAIKSYAPAAEATDIPVMPRFRVVLSAANRGVRALKPKLTPDVPLKLVESDDTTFTWSPVRPLKQTAAYIFSLEDARILDKGKRNLLSIPFSVVGEPTIVSSRTGGYFTPGQSVDIKFGQSVEKNTKPFEFDTPGKSEFTDDRTFRFTPSSLKPGVTHTYKVRLGLRSKAGGVLESDKVYQFSTTGAVGAVFAPGGSSVALASPIRVGFDQPVDHASAQARFSLSPSVPGTFSWSGNTMIYTTTGLAWQTRYTASVAPGVAPVWGLPNTRVLSASFTTVPQVVKLNVPLYLQPYPSSCQVTALRMVLAYRGIIQNENQIVQRVGYAPRVRDKATNSWDNPNEMFVGFMTGYQMNTGYGVHAPPIAKAAKSYGRNATVHYGLTPAFIAARIYEGNPVIFWGRSLSPWADSWNTPSGPVQTWANSHGRVAIGVVGPASNPTGFYINDGWKGAVFWTPAQLMASMNAMGALSNQAVVVY